jgi:choline transporter-like protein 2/4/5
MVIVNGLGGAFIFIGKLFIIVASVFGAYEVLITIEPYKTDIHNPFLPCIFVFVLAYAIATIFM